MKTEIKERWINALRSGEYRQDKTCLRTINGYCCLGVLLDVTKDISKGNWYNSVFVHTCYNSRFGISDSLREEFELTDEMHKKCIVMNDVEGKSFTEIADYLEENL
jgi:hypothetical protein